nr:polyprotein [Rattus argentiventer mosavirus]UYI58730.1 polyprotein [Rattus argentiventer mosavirus]UYI58731.1 polyprotein [Rattus argentiventer mosavirus]UYI58732.1 polyprotein [Rattus argentiventer mosavirus]
MVTDYCLSIDEQIFVTINTREVLAVSTYLHTMAQTKVKPFTSYEMIAFKQIMERFQDEEYRYLGFPNRGASCWFNAARQIIRLAGLIDIHQIFDEMYDEREVINSFCRMMNVDDDAECPDGGWFQGNWPHLMLEYLGHMPVSDDAGRGYSYEFTMTDQDLGYGWDAPKYPLCVIYHKDRQHVVVAAQEDDHYVIYDDDLVYCTKDYTHVGTPIFGTLGTNMLQMTSVSPNVVFSEPKPTSYVYDITGIEDQPWCPLQRDITNHLLQKKSVMQQHTRMLYKNRAYNRWWFSMPKNMGNAFEVATTQGVIVDDDDYWIEDSWVIDYAETQGGGQSKPTQGNVNGSQNQGTQIYNYYNNQYQNSVDMSAPSVTSGAATNSGSASHNSQNNNWSGLLQSAFTAGANLLPLMLMDPDTEESTNLPDRIEEEVEGNTKLTTQSSVGTIVGYRQLRSRHPISSCADRPTLIGPSGQRNFVQYIGTWTTTQAATAHILIPLPHGIDEMGVFTATAARHYTFKCGYKVQVQMNTSQFHAGSLGVFAVPECWLGATNTTFTRTNWRSADTSMLPLVPEQLFVFPHQILNCRTNTTVDLILPYVNFLPTSAYGYHQAWTIIIMVLTPLQIPTGASPTVDISMTVTPTDVVFNGLRQPQAATEGIPVHIRENQMMWASTLPDDTTPVYGLVMNPNTDFIPGEVTNFLSWAKTPTLIWRTDGDEHVYFTANNTRSDQPLLQTDVTATANALHNTCVGALAYRYTQYRGSLNVTLLFTGAAMVKGKFLLVYTPPGAEAPTDIATAMQGTYAIWDLGLQSSYTFTIPFISVSDYRVTVSSTTSTVSVDGWFTVFQYTALTYPAGTPQRSDVLVFASAGEDFSYRNIATIATQGLDNAEEGDVVSTDIIGEQEGKQLEVVDKHTQLGFVFDRSFYYHTTTLTHGNLTTIQLDVAGMKNSEAWDWLSALTYVKADLEITLIPRIFYKNNEPTTGKLHAKFLPVGNIQNDQTKRSQNVGGTPFMVGGMDMPLSFAIPYTSPLSAIPLFYLGYADFQRTAISEYAPAATWGSLVLGLYGVTGTAVEVDIYVRFKNFRGWIPRNFNQAVPRPTTGRATMPTNADEVVIVRRDAHQDVTLSGDVELNPGPFFFVKKEEAVSQGLENLYNFVSGGLFEEAKGAFRGVRESTEGVAGIINSLKEMSEMATDAVRDVRAWMKVVKKIFRMVSYLIIAYRANDPMVTALLGIDAAFGDPFDIVEMMKEKLAGYFRTPAPPLVRTQGFVSDANGIFNLMKNTQWVIQLIATIKDWLNRWIQGELQTPEKQLGQMMPDILEAITVLEAKDQKSQEQKGTAVPLLMRAKALAQACGKTSLAKCITEALKPYTMLGGARMEPIVILLKGKPGQGKTIAATLLAQMLAKEITGDKSSVYSMPPDSKHMDGYCGQAVVIMDDLGQNPDGMDFSTFCQMVSTTQFVTPQASLADKGTCFCSPVVIATTNLSNIRPVTLVEPEAFLRRVTFDCVVDAGLKTLAGTLDLKQALEESLINVEDVPVDHGRRIFSSEVLKLTETRQRVTYSILDIFRKTRYLLKEKSGTVDLLSGIVQGVPSHILNEIRLGILHRPKYKQTFTRRVENDDGQMMEEVTEVTADLYNEFDRFVTMVALVPVFFTIFSLLVNFLSWMLGSNEEEIEEEVDAEGPYNGATKKKTKLAKKVQAEGPYNGMASKKAPVPKKRVNVQSRENKEVKAKFVVITKEEIAETQGNECLDAERSILERNTCPVNYYQGQKQVGSLTAIKICDGKALINRHQFDYSNWEEVEIDGKRIKREDCVITGFFSKAKGMQLDVYMIDVPNMQCRNIVQYFTDEKPQLERVVGCCNSENYKKLMWAGNVARMVQVLNTNDGLMPNTVAYTVPTRSGFCGAPIIARRNGKPVILAIHSAGNGVNGFGTILSRKMIEDAVSQGIMTDEFTGPFVHVNRKSEIKKSPLFDVFEPDAGPAVLSQHDRRLLPGVCLDEALFDKHTGDMDILPQEFEIAADMYAQELFSIIGKDNGVVSMYAALNGDGITDAMDMTTSIGFPGVLNREKRVDKVQIIERPEGKVILPTTELVEETERMFTGAEKPVFVTFLKDEVRSNEKVRNGKTRIVDASPFSYAIAGRMCLMKFMSSMMKHNGVKVGSAVGCDPDTDWTRYCFDLVDRYTFDLDYKAFDSTHPTAMFELLKKKIFTAENGFDADAVAIFIDGLSESHHVYEDRYYKIKGGLPSGCPATSILNTVMNNIIIRAAMLGAYQADTIDFENFRMVAYGDDVVYSTPQPILPGDLADWLHKNTNYKVTPASKAGSFPTESTIWDVTFLKRAFVPDEECPVLIKPVMSEANIKQMLSFMRPGTFADKVRSVAGLACHCDKEFYNDVADALSEVAPGITFPAYSYMKYVWHAKNS